MALQRTVHVILIFAVSYSSASIYDDGYNYRSGRHKPASIFSTGNGEQCLGNDGSTGGVCLPNNQCNAQGGKPIGFCGFFATCCSFNACNVRTNTKVAVFINPPLSRESSGLDCSYNVEINNNNVCQMRIDFETFNLAPPTTVEPVENVTQRPGYTCRNDIFQVTNLQANSNFSPPLCGDNNGQHWYVRVNASSKRRAIRINFKIANRSSHPSLPQATWKIKVTQLECLNTLCKYRDGILETDTRNLPSGKAPFSSSDRDLIAPPGCQQYYPDRSGAFESFNYNRGSGPYIAQLSYATCFTKSSDVCGVNLTAEMFTVAYRSEDNFDLDTDCQSNTITQGSAQSEDYLFIPEAKTADGLRGSKFCGSSANNKSITSTPPGPLYVHFHSDNLVTDDILERGYRFNYTVMNNCSNSILTAEMFTVAYRSEDNFDLDTDCQSNTITQGSAQSEDYLFIPEAKTADGLRGSKFCGSSANNKFITSTPPGPLYVHFHSDNLVTDDILERGYRFNYTVMNNCSNRM